MEYDFFAPSPLVRMFTKVEGCKTCEDPAQRGGPSHEPSSRCESGKRPHCSCDTCF